MCPNNFTNYWVLSFLHVLRLLFLLLGLLLHLKSRLFTRSFLLKGEESPVCIRYDERLTIKHILLTCYDFIEIRESHFAAQSLRVLFQEISLEFFFGILKYINMFVRI